MQESRDDLFAKFEDLIQRIIWSIVDLLPRV